MSETPEQVKAKVRSRLEELAKVSKELENNAKMQAAAPNIVAVEQLKKRVLDLTEQQTRLMDELVMMHPDPATRERYAELGKKLEELQLQVKGEQQIDELKKLEAQIEEAIKQWIYQFQRLVSELTGVEPPDAPVFQKP